MTCTRCGRAVRCHTLLDAQGGHPMCSICLFLIIYTAEQRGETATVTVTPLLALVPA